MANRAEHAGPCACALSLQAGILFGSASGAAATAHHTLEPSPLAAGLQPRHSTGAPAGAEAALGSSSIGSGGVMFAAGGSGGLAQRTTAVRDRSRRSELTAAAFGGMTRSGSQGALAHLSRVGGVPGESAPTEEQEAARRAQRADAAATAAQEHREVKLAEMRSRRLLNSDDAEVGGSGAGQVAHVQAVSRGLRGPPLHASLPAPLTCAAPLPCSPACPLVWRRMRPH